MGGRGLSHEQQGRHARCFCMAVGPCMGTTGSGGLTYICRGSKLNTSISIPNRSNPWALGCMQTFRAPTPHSSAAAEGARRLKRKAPAVTHKSTGSTGSVEGVWARLSPDQPLSAYGRSVRPSPRAQQSKGHVSQSSLLTPHPPTRWLACRGREHRPLLGGKAG